MREVSQGRVGHSTGKHSIEFFLKLGLLCGLPELRESVVIGHEVEAGVSLGNGLEFLLRVPSLHVAEVDPKPALNILHLSLSPLDFFA